MASTSSKLSGKTRKLKVTLSEGTEQIEREVTEKQLSNRTKRRKNYAKEAAVPAWSEFGHTGLFMLTIIICGLLFAYPRLRDGFDGFNFKIAGRWATQCFLFRARGDAAKGAKILPSSRFRALLKAMCLMHLHFPKAVGDRLHRQIKDVVEQMPTLADRVQSMSFFFGVFLFDPLDVGWATSVAVISRLTSRPINNCSSQCEMLYANMMCKKTLRL